MRADVPGWSRQRLRKKEKLERKGEKKKRKSHKVLIPVNRTYNWKLRTDFRLNIVESWDVFLVWKYFLSDGNWEVWSPSSAEAETCAAGFMEHDSCCSLEDIFRYRQPSGWAERMWQSCPFTWIDLQSIPVGTYARIFKGRRGILKDPEVLSFFWRLWPCFFRQLPPSPRGGRWHLDWKEKDSRVKFFFRWRVERGWFGVFNLYTVRSMLIYDEIKLIYSFLSPFNDYWKCLICLKITFLYWNLLNLTSYFLRFIKPKIS